MSTPSSSRDSIVIVGAGIIGLDVALVLAERGYGQSITVIAEHLPGDTALTYTSPWAGCNFSAISVSSHLKDQKKRSSSGRHRQNSGTTTFHMRKSRPCLSISRMYVLPVEQLPDGVKFAASFTTLTVNAPKHMVYLYTRLKRDYGVRFVRQRLPDIHTAFASSSTKVVFNCVGNAARSLPGVEDPKCFPTRGQVLLALAPNVRTNIMRHGKDYETYVIPRPYSNGHVILGGYMQKGVGDGSTYSYETESILDRTRGLSKEIRVGTPEVVAAFAGLRPSREGGARVERQDMTIAGKSRTIIHNYGAGGTGFQAGYGMAVDAVNAAESLLLEMRTGLQSKL
ncbi:hypothetical protein ACJ41O_014299 [Fusarium nematophilum]